MNPDSYSVSLRRKEQWLPSILEKRGVTLVFSNVIDEVRKEIDRQGLTKLIGEEHIYVSLPDVLEAYRKENKQEVVELDN